MLKTGCARKLLYSPTPLAARSERKKGRKEATSQTREEVRCPATFNAARAAGDKFFFRTTLAPVLVPVRASPVPSDVRGIEFSNFLVPVRASPVPSVKKERKQTSQGRDGRTARRHHTGILRSPKERKKENRQPKGGMGAQCCARRHKILFSQGQCSLRRILRRGVWCASRRLPLGVLSQPHGGTKIL